MRKEEIESQIRDFHAKGIGGFFIHARFGLETEYLSREWMDAVKHAVNVAEELDMEVWLYDENGFPSGIGDLKVSAIPEYRSKFIDLTEGSGRDGAQVELDLPSGEVIMAYAHPAGKPDSDRIDLTSEVFENKLIWATPQGEWDVIVYSKCILEDPNDVIFGVDYMNPEAMRYFFDFTLEPYERAVGQHFGKTIKGIFTDEPTLLPWHHDLCWYGLRDNGRVVVWDDLVESQMKVRVGMDAQQFLPHMFFDIDENTPNIRKAFWQTVADLYVKAFFEPYKQWCDDHSMKLTGHVLFEEGLYINTDFQSDITALLSNLHIPGTDHLGEVTECPYGGYANLPRQLTNLQGEKLVASLAHYTGKEAAISETYGCAGWGLSFEKMKWMVDWQYSLGINMLCPHALFYSIEGFRKSDAPPSENHMAGWKHYRKFGDYIGRLSYVLRGGRHVAKVALFYPLKEFWGKHKIGCVDEEDKVISDSFDLCASILTRLHFDYDILSEQALADAEVRDGKIYIQNEEYEALIAPPFAISGKARDNVATFLQTGGKWIFPPLSNGDTEREQIDHEIAMIRRSMSGETAEQLTEAIIQDWSNRQRHIVIDESDGGKLIPTLAGTSDPEGVARALDGALREAIVPDVEITSIDRSRLPDVRYLHREIEGRHAYFVINTSDQEATAIIGTEITGSVEQWNPETGDVKSYDRVRIENDRLSIMSDFAPYGSTIFVVDPEGKVPGESTAPPKREEIMLLPDEWQFSTEEPNALILRDWSYRPIVHSSGVRYEYSTTFTCEFVPDKLLLMLDDIEYRASLMGGMHIAVDLNGSTWDRPRWGTYLDKGFKTLDVAEAAVNGTNKLNITIHHSAWSGQPHLLNAPAYLLGNFALHSETGVILPPVEATFSGSWTDVGYPYFSGTAVYTHGFTLPRNLPAKRLILSVDSVNDAVEIVVNGKSADVRLWQPWEADITELVEPGRNVLTLKVTNSMINFLEGEPRPSGLMGRVRLYGE